MTCSRTAPSAAILSRLGVSEGDRPEEPSLSALCVSTVMSRRLPGVLDEPHEEEARAAARARIQIMLACRAGRHITWQL